MAGMMATYLNVEINAVSKASIIIGSVHEEYSKMAVLTHLNKEELLAILENTSIHYEIIAWNLPKVHVNGYVWNLDKVIGSK